MDSNKEENAVSIYLLKLNLILRSIVNFYFNNFCLMKSIKTRFKKYFRYIYFIYEFFISEVVIMQGLYSSHLSSYSVNAFAGR
jgi:hypothetical protein